MTVQKYQNGDLNEPENELSKIEIEKVIEKLTEIELDFKDMSSILDPIIKKHLKELAGPHFQIMESSHEKAVQYLTDPDPKLRSAAVSIASEDRNKAQSLSSTFEKMAITDPNAEVRDNAFRALGNCHARTKDQRIGRLLASVVLDGTVIDEIRLTAYMSLIRVHGMFDYGGTLVPLSVEEIDWGFVKSYCDSNFGT